MKKIISGILAALFVVSSCLISPVPAMAAVGKAEHTTIDLRDTAGWPAAPEVNAQCAYMIELNSGAILYDKNGDERVFPASTTKTLTAYLALQHLELDKELTFSHASVTDLEHGGSHYEFKEGEILSVDEILQFLLVESVNECGVALAEEISGGIAPFAELMNRTAQEFGAQNTHFNNPHGLNDPEHYTTAKDMAMIQWGIIQDERFRQYASIRQISLKGRKKMKRGFTTYTNHHLMLDTASEYYDPDVVCGKTGFTSIAGSTLVTYARRGDMDLVCVIMKGEDTERFNDTRRLIDYAFDNFELISVDRIGDELPDHVGKTLDPGIELSSKPKVLVPNGTLNAHITTEFQAGPAENHVIGTRTWYYDGTEVASSAVRLSDEAVEELQKRQQEAEAWKVAGKEARKSERSLIEIAVAVLLGLLLIVLVILLAAAIRQNRRRKRALARKREKMRRARMERERRQREYDDRYYSSGRRGR